MTDTKHTKHTEDSHWIAVGSVVEHTCDLIPDICDCNPETFGQGHLHRSYEEMSANARLIAAAPELLEALENLLNTHASQCTDAKLHRKFVEDGWNAITNATGKA